ncbi:MAG: hypothetical protein N4A57_16430 [Anaeromicrobium sp.]|jgi:hypothetical protein|uniref:hypothetical protein n=1 Tax=Anaeromicrobium sp. TaxID=1929132 RepID=UPI0025CDF315|nr:hypothetical protein [Anaeromicrobium sp.]MCT4595835.1 hypothetical protein [Anaeromicrobium sp.]
MQIKTWESQNSFLATIMMGIFMLIELMLIDIFGDGKLPTVWIFIFTINFTLSKKHMKNDMVIFSEIMICNYILFKCGLYIPNYAVFFTVFTIVIIRRINGENIKSKFQKKIIVIIMLIGFFIIDNNMYSNNFIKDKKLYREIKNHNVEEIYNLSISDRWIVRCLDGIEHLKNLHKLYIVNGSVIKSFKPINELKKLEYLSIEHVNLNKLEEIENINSLKELEIVSSKGDKLNCLKSFPNLKKLSIWRGKFVDLDVDNKLENLVQLNLSMAKLESFNGVEKFENLNEINLNRIILEDSSPIFKLRKLKKITLDKCKVSDMNYLKNEAKKRNITLVIDNISSFQ